jgi:DNA modification methylase
MSSHPRENLTLPPHQQLVLPLLEVLDVAGGSATSSEAVAAVAERVGLSPEARELAAPVDRGRPRNLFARRLRWVRQSAVERGLLEAGRRGVWELSRKGKNHLKRCLPGVVITIFESARGGVSLWATAESASAVINDSSIDLIITSPPYPLSTPKNFGNREGDEYLDWLTGLAVEWKRMLVDDGSLVLNLGDVWNRGEPTINLYQERLLVYLADELQLRLAQRFVYLNRAKIPASHWVTIKRVRVRTVTESVLWLSKSPHPRADNRKVLREYTQKMRRLIERGGEHRRLRPCGHGNTRGAFGRDNGGSIPTNVIEATNAASNDEYCRSCRAHGLPIHPARMLDAMVELFVRMLTPEGGVVYDPFAGSNMVGHVAERLGRTWVSSEDCLAYISGSKFRFPSRTNHAPTLCPI